MCKSGSDGVRLEEAKRINKSISALGNCIAALASGAGNGRPAAHVPYRDSKLTRLLTASLGGNTKTTLCASVGPALNNYDETFCTLLLATRAMAVKTHVRINERIEKEGGASSGPERTALLSRVRELQSEVMRLRKESGHAGGAPRVRPPLVTPSGPASLSMPRAPSSWSQHRTSDAPLTWAVGAGHGSCGRPPTSAAADHYPTQPYHDYQHQPPPPDGAFGSHACTGLAGLAGLPVGAAQLPPGQMPLNAPNGASEDAVNASVACTAALQASSRMHVPPPPTAAWMASSTGRAARHTAASTAGYPECNPGARAAAVGWGQVAWNYEATGLSASTLRQLPFGPQTVGSAPAPYLASSEEWPPGAEWPAGVATSAPLQSPMTGTATASAPPTPAVAASAPENSTGEVGGAGVDGVRVSGPCSHASALQARLAQPSAPTVWLPAHEPPASIPPAGHSPPAAGSRVAALAASTAAGLVSAEVTPHPSPSELPVPSQLAITAAAAGNEFAPSLASGVPPHLYAMGNALVAGLQQDALAGVQRQEDGSELISENEGGDVVLDQLVSGLLATPCIRRRLDRLYGKAAQPGGRSLSVGSRLDQLSNTLEQPAGPGRSVY